LLCSQRSEKDENMFYHHPFDDSPEVWYDKIHAEKQKEKKKEKSVDYMEQFHLNQLISCVWSSKELTHAWLLLEKIKYSGVI